MGQRKKKEEKKKKQKKKERNASPADIGDLRKMLGNYGLTIFEVEGDGNCLFRSFASQHSGDQERHAEYREACCEYLASHEEDFKCFIDLEEDEDIESYGDYVKSMREQSTWGSQIELSALCLAYEVCAVVFQAGGVHLELGSTDVDKKAVLISFHDDDHFNAVTLGKDYELTTLGDIRTLLKGCNHRLEKKRHQPSPQILVQV